MIDERTAGELNRLYWGTDASVAEIAERLEISRRALYDGIEPRPAGATCPACGDALVFRNRMAADRREASCETCGREEALPSDAAAGSPMDGGPGPARQDRDPRPSPVAPRTVPGTASGPVLGGALLAGLATGAALGWLLRRG